MKQVTERPIVGVPILGRPQREEGLAPIPQRRSEEPDARLRIEYKNTEPIEVVDFTKSLLAIGDQYRRFVISETGVFAPEQAKLYIKSIREGSIIADLAPYTPLLLPLMGDVNTIFDFGNKLRLLFDFLLGRTRDGIAQTTTIGELEDVKQFFEPIAKDGGSQIIIAPVLNGNATFTMNLTSQEANAIQNSSQRLIREKREPISGIHHKVLFYFFQARDDARSRAGDYGIIENISAKPLKVNFDTEDLKNAFLHISENIFSKAFIVDVDVQTIEDQPRIYKILALHEVVDK